MATLNAYQFELDFVVVTLLTLEKWKNALEKASRIKHFLGTAIRILFANIHIHEVYGHRCVVVALKNSVIDR